MTSSIGNLLEGPKFWKFSQRFSQRFSHIHVDFLPNKVLYDQSNVQMQATFSIMSLRNYQIVRKLSIRFLRNSVFLPNSERFLESSFAKNVQTGVVEATFAILGLSIW